MINNMSYFYPVIGWGVFWISFIASIVLFSIYKKLYPVIYLISVALYVFTAGFAIDVFEFGRTAIQLTLLFSAILFMGLGYYLSIVLSSENNNNKKR
jgi:hypothetical protein